jgi:hypothetical protein
MTRVRVARILLIVLGIWATVAYAAVFTVFVLAKPDPPNPVKFFDNRAVIFMGGILLLVWCLIGGILQRVLRDPFKRFVRRVPIGWRTRFVLLCIIFALLEEAVTTGLTNLAPVFGGVTEAAKITASKNYLEVVCLHSVVVFVPSFIIWAVILSFFDFAPAEVMLLYGLTGWLMELVTFGPQNWGMIGMWVFVYGLMVYLPACTVPEDRKVRRVRWWYWPITVVALLFAGALLMVPAVVVLFAWANIVAGVILLFAWATLVLVLVLLFGWVTLLAKVLLLPAGVPFVLAVFLIRRLIRYTGP